MKLSRLNSGLVKAPNEKFFRFTEIADEALQAAHEALKVPHDAVQMAYEAGIIAHDP